jgi:hypothetical protein
MKVKATLSGRESNLEIIDEFDAIRDVLPPYEHCVLVKKEIRNGVVLEIFENVNRLSLLRRLVDKLRWLFFHLSIIIENRDYKSNDSFFRRMIDNIRLLFIISKG